MADPVTPLVEMLRRILLGMDTETDRAGIRQAVASGRIASLGGSHTLVVGARDLEATPGGTGVFVLPLDTWYRVFPFRPGESRGPVPFFVGRRRPIETVLARLGGDSPANRAACIRGPAGVGKTQTALMIARRLMAERRDCMVFVDLQAGEHPLTAEEALTTTLRTCRPNMPVPDTLTGLLTRLRMIGRGRRGVILLDDAVSIEQIEPFLPPSSGWIVLVTTRRRLGFPRTLTLDLEPLTPDSATELLARFQVPGGKTALPDESAILARLCGYLPLALRIAGAGLAAASGRDRGVFLERLSSRRRGADASDSLAVVLQTLRELLEQDAPDAVRLWRRLSVFAADFNADAALFVAGCPVSEMSRHLQRLAGLGVVERDEATGLWALPRAVRLPVSPVRDGQGPVPGSDDDLAWRHAVHYLEQVLPAQRTEDTERPVSDTDLTRFDCAWANLRVALARMSQRDDLFASRWLCRFAIELDPILEARLSPKSRLPVFETAILAAHRLDDRGMLAGLLGRLGHAQATLGNTREAEDCFGRAIASAREAGDRRAEGSAQLQLGNVRLRTGDAEKAFPCFEEALCIALAWANPRLEIQARTAMGRVALARGRTAEAIEHHDQALAVALSMNDAVATAKALGNLGRVYTRNREIDRAVKYLERAREVAAQAGNLREEKRALDNLGMAWSLRGDLQMAVRSLAQALDIARSLGELRGEASTALALGKTYAALRDADRAGRAFRLAMTLSRESGDPGGEGNALGHLGKLSLARGDAGVAVQFLAQAVTLLRAAGDDVGSREMLHALGDAMLANGDPAGAATCFEQAAVTDEAIPTE